MKKILVLTAFCLTLSVLGFSQTPDGKITGHVIDGSSKIIESATITLLNASDSSVVKIGVADKNGNFVFEGVSSGAYMVSISAIGHEKGFSETFEVNDSKWDVKLNTIELVPAAKSLAAVVVSSKKPLVEQKIDRMVVNVEAAISNVGATAMEVLEKSPGVSVDKDGNISLKGKPGVQVYLDGRPSYLSNADLANMLRNMNANQLEQIEIMTNPPAKYDAAGNAGIINIKTKKNKQVGYSGNVSLNYGQGRYDRWNESASFNYRKNKVNVFSNIGYNSRTYFNNLDIQRKFIEANSKELKSHFDQESRMHEVGESYNAKLGMDYYASKKTTLGVVFTGFKNSEIFSSKSDILISDPNRTPLSITRAATANDMVWKNFGTNLNFRHIIDTTGSEITADADFITYTRNNMQDLVNAYFDNNGLPSIIPDTLLGDLPQDIKIYSFKTDYVKPLKNNSKLEAGIKTSFVKTDNNAVYDSLLNGQHVPDLGRTNHFIYKENINAAYVSYSRPISKKFSGQLGLRLEHTHAIGDQSTTGEKFDKDYVQLFPTAYLQYTMNDKNSFVLNYGRRIQRPNYQDLNPFIFFLDRYTFEQGNPNLQPQFAHNIELSHTFKGFLTTTLNYTRTTDIITDVLEQNTDKNQTFVKKSNIANQRQYGISVNAGGQVKKWWMANVWANVYNNLYKGVINGDYTKLGATTFQANVMNQFKFAKTWSAEVGGYYRSPFVEGVFRIDGFGMLNVGVGKQILKGKGSLRLSVRDILYTQKIDGSSKFSNIDATFQQQRDSRVATLNFTYRFSKGKANGQRRRSGSASDEQSRVNAGNNN